MQFIKCFSLILIFAVLAVGCSSSTANSTRNHSPKDVVLARVGNNEITLEELFENPGVRNTLENNIKRFVIENEFKKRGLKLTDESELWDKFIEIRFQGDEQIAINNLQSQGMTKEFAMKNLRMEHHLEQIFLDINPISIDEVREDFHKNVRGNQLMFKAYAPEEKVDDPESITFDDVQEPYFENFKRRRMTAEGPAMLESIIQDYKNKGLIENYMTLEKFEGLTKIERQDPVQRLDPSEAIPAPIHKPQTEPIIEQSEEPPADEKSSDDPVQSEQIDDSTSDSESVSQTNEADQQNKESSD